jgi:hypothetical protein
MMTIPHVLDAVRMPFLSDETRPDRTRLAPVWRGLHLPALCLAVVLSGCAVAHPGEGDAPQVAGADVGAGQEGQLRVICITMGDRLPDDRLAVDLARAAGLGVLHVRAIGARTFAVRFDCGAAERCEQGLARLQAAHQLLAEVSMEGRRGIPRAPTRQERP